MIKIQIIILSVSSDLLLMENRNQNLKKFNSFSYSISSSMIGRNNNK